MTLVSQIIKCDFYNSRFAFVHQCEMPGLITSLLCYQGASIL
uniref:Uncharacterized protein n=1 Tax=Anguilla anguilla TaxID=7936 RepID=A0A0E9TNW6_ANGAN